MNRDWHTNNSYLRWCAVESLGTYETILNFFERNTHTHTLNLHPDFNNFAFSATPVGSLVIFSGKHLHRILTPPACDMQRHESPPSWDAQKSWAMLIEEILLFTGFYCECEWLLPSTVFPYHACLFLVLVTGLESYKPRNQDNLYVKIQTNIHTVHIYISILRFLCQMWVNKPVPWSIWEIMGIANPGTLEQNLHLKTWPLCASAGVWWAMFFRNGCQ